MTDLKEQIEILRLAYKADYSTDRNRLSEEETNKALDILRAAFPEDRAYRLPTAGVKRLFEDKMSGYRIPGLMKMLGFRIITVRNTETGKIERGYGRDIS